MAISGCGTGYMDKKHTMDTNNGLELIMDFFTPTGIWMVGEMEPGKKQCLRAVQKLQGTGNTAKG